MSVTLWKKHDPKGDFNGVCHATQESTIAEDAVPIQSA